MRDDETFQDLSSLFAAEDRALEAKPFADDVMGKVRRRKIVRKVFLLAAGGAGALLAALQVPNLLGDWILLDGSVDTTILSAISSAQQQAGLLASADPIWLAIAGVVGVTVAAVTTMERT